MPLDECYFFFHCICCCCCSSSLLYLSMCVCVFVYTLFCLAFVHSFELVGWFGRSMAYFCSYIMPPDEIRCTNGNGKTNRNEHDKRTSERNTNTISNISYFVHIQTHTHTHRFTNEIAHSKSNNRHKYFASVLAVVFVVVVLFQFDSAIRKKRGDTRKKAARNMSQMGKQTSTLK